MTPREDALDDSYGYDDFELGIGSGRGRSYPIRIRSRAGDVSETMRFPFSQRELEEHLKEIEGAILRSALRRRLARTASEGVVLEFGRQLFEAAFPAETRRLYYESRREAGRDNRGLRLKLRIEPPLLASLPWEFLWDPLEANYIGLSMETPVVRDLGLAKPIDPLSVNGPLRILAMVASPPGLDQLDVASERRRLEEALSHLCDSGLVELQWLEGQTWRDLLRAIRRDTFHVFHFVGHGGYDPASDEGIIAIADDVFKDRPRLLNATDLAMLLADERQLRLVVLNSCEGAKGGTQNVFSSTASILVRRGIPAVLAMQYEITDDAAIEFSRVFYESIADGVPVDGAVGTARQAVRLALPGSLEWATPVLFQRAPDGVLFTVREPSPPEDEPTPPPTSPPENLGLFYHWQTLSGHSGAITTLAFACDGQALASGSWDTTVRIWQPVLGTSLHTLKAQTGWRSWANATNVVHSVEFSPDGQSIASGTTDKTVRLWRRADGTLMRTFTGHTDGVWTLAFSPDGQTLASGADDTTIRLYRAGDGSLVRTLTGHSHTVWSVAFSPDGQTLASAAAEECDVKLWPVMAGTMPRTLGWHLGWVRSIAFSPDGQTVASGSDDTTIRLWRVADGQLLQTLNGHNDTVWSVAFSPDGQTLASACNNAEIGLWRVSDGSLVTMLTNHSGPVYAVAFAPDGRTIASGGEDKNIRLWRAADA